LGQRITGNMTKTEKQSSETEPAEKTIAGKQGHLAINEGLWNTIFLAGKVFCGDGSRGGRANEEMGFALGKGVLNAHKKGGLAKEGTGAATRGGHRGNFSIASHGNWKTGVINWGTYVRSRAEPSRPAPSSHILKKQRKGTV